MLHAIWRPKVVMLMRLSYKSTADTASTHHNQFNVTFSYFNTEFPVYGRLFLCSISLFVDWRREHTHLWTDFDRSVSMVVQYYHIFIISTEVQQHTWWNQLNFNGRTLKILRHINTFSEWKCFVIEPKNWSQIHKMSLRIWWCCHV